jgi:tetratricopeptide (TPR) repeat protein
MRPRFLPLAVLGGLGLTVILLVVRLRSIRTMPIDPPVAAASVPGRDNVAPSYHTREMQLRERLEVEPSDTAALGALGRLLQDGHRSAQAAALLERYAAIAPDRQVLLDLAVAYEAASDLASAKRSIDRLLELFPDDPAGLYDRGAIEANLGNAAGARPWFDRAAAQTLDTVTAAAARAALARLNGSR